MTANVVAAETLDDFVRGFHTSPAHDRSRLNAARLDTTRHAREHLARVRGRRGARRDGVNHHVANRASRAMASKPRTSERNVTSKTSCIAKRPLEAIASRVTGLSAASSDQLLRFW